MVKTLRVKSILTKTAIMKKEVLSFAAPSGEEELTKS